MAIVRTFLFALLLLGLPLGAIEAPPAPSAQPGQAAGPIDLAGGWDAPAAPEIGGSRKAPECSAAGAFDVASIHAGLGPERFVAPEAGAPGARTPLYLSHCAFLC